VIDIQFLGFHLFEWIAFLSSGIYTFLAARGNIWCWLFGMVGALFTLILCFDVQLYSEVLLQVFYIGMSIYGWVSWRSAASRNRSGGSFTIQKMSSRLHWKVIVLGLIVALILGYIWSWLGGALPYIDALTTSFSIITTWLIAKRYLENWLYWIVIDLTGIYLYVARDLNLLGLLFVVYTLLAIYGYMKWRKLYER